ncbi:MAG: hypothetical protein LBK60_08925 [Verrucomicrobiales bacterium]|jgi:hypothetical protein|nr:hypothetical protein [Verrucomicrobiales bacterium]
MRKLGQPKERTTLTLSSSARNKARRLARRLNIPVSRLVEILLERKTPTT